LTKEKWPVNRLVKLVLVGVVGLVLLSATPVLAAEPAEADSVLADGLLLNKYFSAALVVIGAAYGIGRLASSAYEGMSRQPEVAGNIQTAMIIAAALIEGFTFFALVICMLF
jgi:F-type H+-transporting ATPase subunit c